MKEIPSRSSPHHYVDDLDLAMHSREMVSLDD